MNRPCRGNSLHHKSPSFPKPEAPYLQNKLKSSFNYPREFLPSNSAHLFTNFWSCTEVKNFITWQIFIFFLRWSFALVTQAGVQWCDLGSPQPLPREFKQFSYLSLQVAGTAVTCHPAQLIFVFLVETGFHHVGQDGLELLTSWSTRLGLPKCWDYRREPPRPALIWIFKKFGSSELFINEPVLCYFNYWEFNIWQS